MSEILTGVNAQAAAVQDTDTAFKSDIADTEADEQPQEVDIETLIAGVDTTSDQQKDTEQTDETGAETGAADQQADELPVYKTQAEVDAAIGQRLHAARAKVLAEHSTQIKRGELLERYTAGMTDEEITAMLEEVAANRIAEQDGIDQNTAKSIVKRTMKQPAAKKEADQAQAAPAEQQSIAARAQEAISLMGTLNDPNFTPETLKANTAAMNAWVNGEAIGTVYRKYFIGTTPPAAPTAKAKKAPAVEKRGTSYTRDIAADTEFTDEQIDAMIAAVDSGKTVRFSR